MSLIKQWIESWSKQGKTRRRRPANRLRGQLETLEGRSLLASVLTYHNDAGKTGQNLEETVLTRTNVNVNTFGKVFSVTLDGDVYAQPLLKEDVNITIGPNAGVRDVVFVPTQHGSLYAIDAKAHTSTGQGLVLWKRNLLDVKLPGATSIGPVLRDDVGSGYLETVTTGTPVIDAVSNTLYLLTKSREVVSGQVHFVHRIHAINLSNGTARVAPFVIGDTVHTGNEVYINKSPVWVHGTGDGNDGNGKVFFNALRQHTRTAMTLFQGVLYAGWASHESRGPYHGWVVGFDAKSLALRAVFNTTPNGGLGGIWQSGGGLATDGTALYFQTANGSFGGNNGNLITPKETGAVTGLDANGFPINGNYGNSILKVVPDAASSVTNQNINGWGLKVVDYFTPFNQRFLEERDLDLGSGAPMLLPREVGSDAHPNLLVGAGKEGQMYLVDRDNMGKFGTKNNNLQTVGGQLSGSFDTPAYYKNTIYYVEGFGGTAKTFSISNAVMSSEPTTRSIDTFTYAGSTPSISANGSTNGIVWDVDRGTNQLRAYSTDSYAQQLYNSGQAPGNRDSLGTAATFQVPTVANGFVYLGTASGATSTLVAYGLITPPNARPTAPSNLRAEGISGTQVNLAWQANDTNPNTATAYLLQLSNDGGLTWNAVSSGIATSFTVGGLQKSTNYKFRVAAVNSIGMSPFSNILTVTTTSSAGGVNFANGFGATPGDVLALNGAQVVNNALVLTDGEPSTFRGVFTKVKQDVTRFSNTFDFQISVGPSANGFTFTIQSDTTTPAAGGWQNSGSEGLAYGSVSQVVFPNSIALKFDLFRAFDLYENSGDYISTTGLYKNGAMPTTPEDDMASSGIDLHSGHVMRAVINYDLATKQLELTVLNTVTKAQFRKVYNDVDVPATVGGGSAYVGFTAASGRVAGTAATQRILNWKFAPAGPPSAPAGLRTLVIGQTPGNFNPPPLSVKLAWNAVPGATGYTIERRLGLVANYEVLATVGSLTTSYTNENVGTQADYYYRIKASNAAGDSAYSEETVATTPGRVPTPRFGQATAVTATSIALKWTDFATNEDGFHIKRRSGASPYTYIAVLPARAGTGDMTFVDSGLTPGTNYDYHIEAFNLVGYSDYSGVNTDTPALSGPPQAYFAYQSTPRPTAVDSVVLRFSKPVTGLSKEDLTLTRNGVSISLTAITISAVNNRTYSINLGTLAAANGAYRLVLTASGSGIKDSANLALAGDAALSWTKETTTPKILSFTQVTPGPTVELTNAAKLVYSLRFSEPVSAVPMRMLTGFGLAAHDPVITTDNNKDFTITIDQLAGSGLLQLGLNDETNFIRDRAGNIVPLGAYPAMKSITIDRTPPAVTIRKVLLEKGGGGTLTATQLLSTDARVPADKVIYTIKTLPQSIAIRAGGVTLQAGGSFTQRDIDTFNVTFRHNSSSITTDACTFTVSDGLTSSTVKSLPFEVVPFNTPPTFEPVAAQQTPFQTPLAVAGVKLNDANAGLFPIRVKLSVIFGNVSLSSTGGLTFLAGTGKSNTAMTFTGTLASINAAMNGLMFTPQTGYSGTAKINLEANDLGNGGTRVPKSSIRQITVTILARDSQPSAITLVGTNGDDNMQLAVDATQVVFVRSGTTYRYSRTGLSLIRVFGHGGNDSITIQDTNGLAVNVYGGEGNDELTVGPGVTTRVTLLGEGGNDVLTGGSGSDILNGGPGSDRLIGNAGSDRYLFGNAGLTLETDTVVELANGGVDVLDFFAVNQAITVDLRRDANLAAQPGRTIVTGGSGRAIHFEGVVGGHGNDVLRGNDGINYLGGSVGNDILSGFLGKDTLVGGSGDDVLIGGNGNDALAGGFGSDTYLFAAVAGTIAETDTLTELTDQGTDVLDFSGISTPLAVELSKDTLATHLHRALVTKEAGQYAFLENVVGGSAADTLRGNGVGNVLDGRGGNDLLLGMGGPDTLIGGGGNDRLGGGDGSDLLEGGAGDDAYEFADVTSGFAETDTVLEWASAGFDVLNFRYITSTVTVNLQGDPLATHQLRTVVPGSSAELESVLKAPAGIPASSGQIAAPRPTYPAQVDQWMAAEADEDEELISSLAHRESDSLFGE